MNATVRGAVITGAVTVVIGLIAFFADLMRDHRAEIDALKVAQARDETRIEALREQVDRIEQRLSPTP